MKFPLLAALSLSSLLCASASPIAEPSSSTAASSRCKHPPVRREWRALSHKDRKAYLRAVKCLAKLPSKHNDTIAGAVTRYDDFQGVHSAQTDFIHFVGHFALWHRHFVAAYETALRNECGWTQGTPYWDWLLDTESDVAMPDWEIFSPAHGFGGNGPFVEISPEQNFLGIEDRTGGGCVQDGPFTLDAGFVLNLGPSKNVTVKNPHCLTRDFAPTIAATNLVRSVWDGVLGQPSYKAFARALEAEPSFDVKNVHGGGHFGVGGVLGGIGDAYNSPSDPLFYLHHGNLDRLLWKWTEMDRKKRVKDVGGPVLPFDYKNERGPDVTLDFKINLGPMGMERKLSELTDTRSGALCYTYEDED
ncbi:hypothetical protein EDC01DRAFT_64775 [Geopyxis carbonaria]|nr:hypothetical protein EDC01DRAFT_64775 [Geopyxis carbonaria]